MKRLDRRTVYGLLWTCPATHVAASLGISSVSLAKTCRLRGIPMPPRGYWQRLEAGQQMDIPELTEVEVELPLPWAATPEFEGLVEKRNGLRNLNPQSVEGCATADLTPDPQAIAPKEVPADREVLQADHARTGPSTGAIGEVLAEATALQHRRRLHTELEELCDDVLRLAASQPLSVAEVLEAWVRAARRENRTANPIADLVDQCTRVAGGTLAVAWWPEKGKTG